MSAIIPIERIASKIYVVRGQKVMIDKDLAELYSVKTKVLNQAVKRKIRRFPKDFMFSLTREEIASMSQIVTSSDTLKFSKNVNVFTEQGVAMLSSVLNSNKAIQINVSIMRAFVKMREYLSTHKQILEKLKKHDENFVIVFKVLKQMAEKPVKKQGKKYGFRKQA